MQQSHWLLCVAKTWLVQENHATVKLDSKVVFSWNENLQRKQNWTAKSTNSIENTGKLKSVFAIKAALWAEKLGSCLENCRSWKTTLGKLAVAVNLEAIRFEFWMKGALLTVEMCVLCGWWFSNQSEIASETPFSCDTVGRELWRAIFCSLLCPENGLETYASESKVMCLSLF